MSRNGGPLGHREDIQGLRAVAVLLVVLGHAGVGFLRGGFIGVDVFFVLSGFLITGLLLADAQKRGRVSLKEFYARRAKRILPAAALTLIVTDVAARYLLNVVRAQQAVLDSIWAVLFSANVQFARQGVDYFAQGQPPSPIQHYWSLAVEEQFYLVWPLLLSVLLVGVALHRRRRRHWRPDRTAAARSLKPGRLAVVIVAAGLASLAWSILDTNRSPAGAYFSTLARAWELALGAALAIAASRFATVSDRTRAVMGWAGALCIGVAAVLFSEATPFPGSAALVPTVGTALVIAAGIGNERSPRGVGRLLGRAPLRYVGDRSYAFYLWHWPALVIAAYYVGHEVSVTGNLALLAVAFLVSMASFRLIENPIRHARLERPIRTSEVLWGTSVGMVGLVALLGIRSIAVEAGSGQAVAPDAVHAFAPLPQPSEPGGPGTAELGDPPAPAVIPAVVVAVEAARLGAPIPSPLLPPVTRLFGDRYDFPRRSCYAEPGETLQQEVCQLVGGASRTIVVFGDSHARQWIPTVSWVASQDGWNLVPLVELGCRPSRYDTACTVYFEWAMEQIKTLHPDVVLIGGQLMVDGPGAMQATVAGIGHVVEAVTPFAKDVIVIGDPPAQSQQPVDCLLARNATMGTCTSTLTKDQVSVYDDVRRAARRGGAAFVDTMDWFCFEHQCPMVIDRTIAYRDIAHITQTYALQLRELFRAEFARAVSQ